MDYLVDLSRVAALWDGNMYTPTISGQFIDPGCYRLAVVMVNAISHHPTLTTTYIYIVLTMNGSRWRWLLRQPAKVGMSDISNLMHIIWQLVDHLCRILFSFWPLSVPGCCPKLMPTTNISSERAWWLGSDSCHATCHSTPATRERGVNEINYTFLL